MGNISLFNFLVYSWGFISFPPKHHRDIRFQSVSRTAMTTVLFSFSKYTISRTKADVFMINNQNRIVKATQTYLKKMGVNISKPEPEKELNGR